MLRSSFLSPGLLIAPLLCAQYTATVKTSVNTVESPDWKKWSDKECVINYPATWTNEGALGTEAITTFFAPADEAGSFRERVVLTSMPATGKTISDLAKATEAEASALLTGPQSIGANTSDDSAVLEMVGSVEGVPVRLKRELSLHGGKAWVLTYLAPQNRYEEGLYMADAIFMSFAVK